MNAAVIATSHYLQPLNDNESLPPLDKVLNAACRTSWRRVDRFIQLALLGSARCVGAQKLSADCGVYLASGLGPLGSTIRVQEQILRDRVWPMPFNFVNTLGSCAGFYIASNLGLDGPNLFVSRRGQSLLAALTVALTDFAADAIEEALVGVIEEAPLPLATQRRRLGVGAETPLAEGSHWLLLANRSPRHGERRLRFEHWHHPDELHGRLPPSFDAADRLCAGHHLSDDIARRLRRHYPGVVESAADLPFHDSREAAWLIGGFEDNEQGGLWLIDGADDSNGYLLHCGAQAPIDAGLVIGAAR